VVGTNVLMPLLAAAIVALVAASIVLGARR
jgi:hypothetical protein